MTSPMKKSRTTGRKNNKKNLNVTKKSQKIISEIQKFKKTFEKSESHKICQKVTEKIKKSLKSQKDPNRKFEKLLKSHQIFSDNFIWSIFRG